MRALIKILGATLARDDPRWLAFGLQMPPTNTTPGKPLNLTATTDDFGAIVVQCDGTALAMRYRWRMLLVGVESDYRLVARSTAPLASIPGVMPGQVVEIIAQAVNDRCKEWPAIRSSHYAAACKGEAEQPGTACSCSGYNSGRPLRRHERQRRRRPYQRQSAPCPGLNKWH